MELCLELSLSSFCAVYIVLLRQCYVAMPSGYKLVITRALRMCWILLATIQTRLLLLLRLTANKHFYISYRSSKFTIRG